MKKIKGLEVGQVDTGEEGQTHRKHVDKLAVVGPLESQQATLLARQAHAHVLGKEAKASPPGRAIAFSRSSKSRRVCCVSHHVVAAADVDDKGHW